MFTTYNDTEDEKIKNFKNDDQSTQLESWTAISNNFGLLIKTILCPANLRVRNHPTKNTKRCLKIEKRYSSMLQQGHHLSKSCSCYYKVCTIYRSNLFTPYVCVLVVIKDLLSLR